jgi:hypothetical protein
MASNEQAHRFCRSYVSQLPNCASAAQAAASAHDNADAGAAMTASNVLDWIVALLVCWASLTAIFEPSRGASQCDVPYATGNAPQAALTVPAQAEFEEMIRDMRLHD